MLIPDLDLPHVVLHPGDDAALARAIEAGLYAQHLIDKGAPDPRLPQVVARGEEASRTLSWVGIRMALKYALRVAHVSGLPEDELFQDGCVAVGEAIRRFDHARGIRFTTFVHEYLFRVMSDAGHHRVGQPQVSRADRRAARREEFSASAAARRGRIRLVELDEALHAAVPPPEEEGPHGTDFLALLLPRHRQVLRLRYGMGGQQFTLVQIAELMHASPSTVARWEREALEAARQLLAGERTTMAAAYREVTAAIG